VHLTDVRFAGPVEQGCSASLLDVVPHLVVGWLAHASSSLA
jgi:hypothetical protein